MDIQPVISTNPYLNKYASRLKDSSMPVINFADYLVEKGAFSSKEELMQYIRDTSIFYDDEKNTENSASSQTDYLKPPEHLIAKFDGLSRFHSTGDAELDKKIDIGLDYYATCFNYKYSDDYDKLTAEEDFTGMTITEKYKAVYEKYQHCYGENFLEAWAVRYSEIPSYINGERVIHQFMQEIEKVCGKPTYSEVIKKARKEALYGDASNEEVRQIILDKYRDGDNLTMRNLFKAAYEMDECGVGGNGLHTIVVDRLESDCDSVDDYYNENHFYLRQSKLDEYITPYQIRKMVRDLNSYTYCGNGSPELTAAVNQIIAACNGGAGSKTEFGMSGGWVSLENANNISVSQTSRGVRL